SRRISGRRPPWVQLLLRLDHRVLVELALVEAVDRDVPDRMAARPADEGAARDRDVLLGADRGRGARRVGDVLLPQRLRDRPERLVRARAIRLLGEEVELLLVGGGELVDRG